VHDCQYLKNRFHKTLAAVLLAVTDIKEIKNQKLKWI